MARPADHQVKAPAAAALGFGGRAFLVAVVVFALLVYRDLLVPGRVHFTTDDNIGAMALRQAVLPAAFAGGWDDSVLAGQPWLVNFTWTNLWLLLLPLRWFQNWIHAIDLVPACLFFALFLRRRGMAWAAALLGALAGFWVGSNFFLNYAGHIGKFGTLTFAALGLWLIERAVQRRSWADALLAGGAVGVMFLEQPDVGLFFALAWGGYAVFACWREFGRDVAAGARLLAPMLVTAAALAYHPLWTAYSAFAHDGGIGKGTTKSPAEIWDYCTQWSWPPEETIEWIAPGYTGWRSGEPAGPYTGRMGRSAGWQPSGPGFRNFKLETLYIGAIPISLAALAVFLLATRRLDERGRRLDAVFWTAVLAVTFLLGLGKFFPLYRLFFELPGMSSIRNPVKFMQVAQVALAVLVALGADETLRRSAAANWRHVLAPYLRGLSLAGALLVVWAIGLGFAAPTAAQKLVADGWGAASSVILQNRIWSLAHGGVLLWAAWALLRASAGSWGGLRAVLALAAIAAVDQLTVSRHYVKAVDTAGLIDRNPAIEYLKQQTGHQRIYLLTQESFYGQWLSIQFPYHGLASFNFPQARLGEDYEQFLGAVGSRLPLLWQAFAVGPVMGPAGFWPQLQNDPQFKDRLEVGFAFNVGARGAGVEVVPGTAVRPGQQVILRHTRPAPRYGLLAGWEAVSDEEILRRYRDGGADPLKRAWLSPEDVAGWPASEGEGLVGSVSVLDYRPGRVRLQVATDRPAVLRLAERYAPQWRATVGGEPAKLLRCDYLFQAVPVDAGLQEVVVTYAPSAGSLWVQAGGMGLCLFGVGALFVQRKRAAPV